jgi:hypothetical protein
MNMEELQVHILRKLAKIMDRCFEMQSFS